MSESYSPTIYEGSAPKGRIINCGYHGTAAGWIIRDGTLWIATFGSEELAEQYVAMRNAAKATEVPNG
jgi:hypothetical protein